jgi:hypothetical protein
MEYDVRRSRTAIHVQLACTLTPFASLGAPLDCYCHWLQISGTYSRLAWPAYAYSYDFACLCAPSLFICALPGWLSLHISGVRWLLARWPWLGRIPLRGPVGPVPGFDRVRSCGLRVDRGACKRTLQAPWVFRNIEVTVRRACTFGHRSRPPPSSASSAGAPGSPQFEHPMRIGWESCRIEGRSGGSLLASR